MQVVDWTFDASSKPTRPTRISLDLETFLLSPAVQAPPVVAAGFSVDGGRVHIVAANDSAFDRVLEELLSDKTVCVFGHNLSFDLACLLAHGAKWGLQHWPAMIFGALQEDRALCTLVQEKLVRIAVANPRDFKTPFNLGACAEKWGTPTQPDKADPWRLRWGTLAHLPVSSYPSEATKYLVEDVQACDELFVAQRAKYPQYLLDAARQTRASVALRLMSCWGLATDPEMVEKARAETQADLDLARAICQREGLIRENGTRDIKAASARMEAVYAARGEEAPRGDLTPIMELKGLPANVRLDEEACLASGDPVMKAYSKATQAATLLAKVERLMHPVIQPTFDVLKETGRTSCSQGKDPKPGEAPSAYGAQVQNISRAVYRTCGACEGEGCSVCGGKGEIEGTGLRECFRARPGRVLLDIDYAAMELRTLAQVERWWFGSSALGDILNDPKRCPHVEAGAMLQGLPVAEAYALKKTDPKKFKQLRQLAKAVNFGTPGGLGAARLVDYARDSYGVTMTEEEAREILRTIKRIYPERGPYLKRVADWSEGGRYRFTQPYSQRVRGGLGYTDGCNSPFQSAASDAAKEACWRVAVHCYVLEDSPLYGARPINMVHDQLVVEADETTYAKSAAELQAQWVGGAQAVIPDILILAEPAAMRNWSKEAGDPVRDADGRLMIYEDWKAAH